MPIEPTLLLVGASYLLTKSGNRGKMPGDTLLTGDIGMLNHTIDSDNALMIESEVYGRMSQTANHFSWIGQYDQFIYTLCKSKYRYIDPVIIKAIIKQESGFNPSAIRNEPQINDASIGLMQVLIATAKQTAPFPNANKDQIKLYLLKPTTNICVGTKYFAAQYARYLSNYEKAIAAYNAGSAILRQGTKTFINQGYVNSVLGYAQSLANDFPPMEPTT